MGSAAVKASIAVGRLLREKRNENRLTLRQVSDRMAKKGDRIPVSTLARIEQGKLDPGVRRLHLLLDLYQVPPHLVADLVELETISVDEPPSGDAAALLDQGVDEWRKGKIRRGLACLFAARERVGDDADSRILRQKTELTFAVAARNLGKLRLAKQIVDDLLCEPPDPSLRTRVLVLASSLWRGLGSLEMAMAVVRHASAAEGELAPEERAWLLHQEAKLLVESGELDEADTVLDRAEEHYRGIGDTYNEGRAMLLRCGLLDKRGSIDAAVECARRLLEQSLRNGHSRLVVSAHLELGRLLIGSGAEGEGLEELNEGLGQAVLLRDRSAEFHAHHSLWKAFERLGDADRAQYERKAAEFFVRFIDDHSPEADEVRSLSKK
jgi:tetratricopeptide (TPR) repeat protein